MKLVMTDTYLVGNEYKKSDFPHKNPRFYRVESEWFLDFSYVIGKNQNFIKLGNDK